MELRKYPSSLNGTKEDAVGKPVWDILYQETKILFFKNNVKKGGNI